MKEPGGLKKGDATNPCLHRKSENRMKNPPDSDSRAPTWPAKEI
jgi:hypothetical protein